VKEKNMAWACRITVAVCIVALSLMLAACEREERRFRETPSGVSPANVRVSELQPGPAIPTPQTTGPYATNAYAIAEGQRLYTQFNCVGCHAHGGGGMGPPLMDDKWIYGSEPANIFATIVEGRPNGMPAFGGKLANDQVWQLVAYVRSLSGLVRQDAASGRSDHMQVKKPEMETDREIPTSTKAEHPQ
jgi:cytochrome c oxidase cbb3-type subunit 3